jgi:hypothetical protein
LVEFGHLGNIICSPKKSSPKSNAVNGTITGILLIETKSFGGIWSFGEDSMMLYMGGRQIFETSQEVHKREEDNKSNKQVIAKLLIQMFLLVLY